MASDDAHAPIRVLMLGPDLAVQGGITTVESLMLRHVPEGIRIEHVGTFGTESKLGRAVWYLLVLPKAARRILSRRTDVVHVHFASYGSTVRKFPLVLLALAARKPLVLHANGAQFESFFKRLPKPLRAILAATFGRATVLVAVSETWMKFYAEQFRLGSNQQRVLPNPVELPDTIPDRAGRGEVTFLSLGRIGQRKGSFDILAAARQARSDGLPLRVVLAGDGEVHAARARAMELGIADCVEVIPWVGSDERRRLLDRADVFILPSYHEGLPLALMEAMAAGLPSITTRVGGIPEVVRHETEGLLVQPGDVPGIAAAMGRLCTDKAARFRMGAAARVRVEPLAISHYMARFAEVYHFAASAARDRRARAKAAPANNK